MKNLNDYTHPPASGNKPKQIIVLLHGYGSNGQDLISLAPYWQAAVPDAVFVSPDAPFPCEMMPDMQPATMHQWFSLVDRNPEKDLAGVEKASPILDHYLDTVLAKYDLTDDKLAFVGFSQGTMMSLYTGLRRKNRIAGILGYSGALIGGETLNLISDDKKPPLYLVHGESDGVVPVDKYHESTKILKENDFQVSGHTTSGLEHSIDGDGIDAGSKFLCKILS